MTVEVGKVYFVSIKYPNPLNDPSPMKPQPPPSSHGWCTVNGDSSTSIRTEYGHVGLVLHYDNISKFGVIFLDMRNPRQAHHFVPWFGTVRKAFEPLAPLEPDPLEAFCNWPSYINFSHAILVKVIGMNDPVFPTIPSMAMVWNMVVNGDLVNTDVRPNQIAYLQSLRANCWLGKRFSEDGFYLSNSNVQHH